jgi:hypothetical protein
LSIVAAIVVTRPGLAGESGPIEGRVTPDRVTADVGATVVLRLEMSATEALDRVAVRLKIPQGMMLLTGTADAEIRHFVPRENRVFEYRLRLDGAGVARRVRQSPARSRP